MSTGQGRHGGTLIPSTFRLVRCFRRPLAFAPDDAFGVRRDPDSFHLWRIGELRQQEKGPSRGPHSFHLSRGIGDQAAVSTFSSTAVAHERRTGIRSDRSQTARPSAFSSSLPIFSM